ncbi:MAG: hypothetical protein DRI57_16985 [Deltaproteobacteria bacterium]|nr:MAG: hypothetical protein DRI57_16985 [Deltaproteobacteria bacterium]
MNVLFIISTDDAETSYNAMRLANVAVKKGDDVPSSAITERIFTENPCIVMPNMPKNMIISIRAHYRQFQMTSYCFL